MNNVRKDDNNIVVLSHSAIFITDVGTTRIDLLFAVHRREIVPGSICKNCSYTKFNGK